MTFGPTESYDDEREFATFQLGVVYAIATSHRLSLPETEDCGYSNFSDSLLGLLVLTMTNQ